MILEGSGFELLEAIMRFSFVQRRYLEPRTLTIRLMRYHCVTATPQDKNSYSSLMMITDHSNRPNADLYFPFSAGTRWVSTNVDYCTSDSKSGNLREEEASG
jgi:hypothetical protein